MSDESQEASFRCNVSVPFDLFDLPRWATSEQAAGRIPRGERVAVRVTHPDKEAEGSCRWCGCRADEVIVVANGKLA
ncbi:hypothetical protein AYO38_04465 [bacterium SCGC AG-212-C10]|nr:hypothetical protein AYO38_04465 [bacterium SCGC AG-212-C10]